MTNKTNFVLGLFVVTAMTLGFTGYAEAATYQYVNTSGQIAIVSANSVDEALRTAYLRLPNSGVMLSSSTDNIVTGAQTVSGSGINIYKYINTSGQIAIVMANSVSDAFKKASNISPHSGVMLVK